MNKRTTNALIAKKMKDWVSSIQDPKLATDVLNNLLVSGGAIASLLTNQPVKDYDVYIQDKDVLLRLMEYYIRLFQKAPAPRSKFDAILLDTTRAYPRCVIRSQGVVGLDGVADDDDDADEAERIARLAQAPGVTLFEIKRSEAEKVEKFDMADEVLRQEATEAHEQSTVDLDDEQFEHTAGTVAAVAQNAEPATGVGRYHPVFFTTNAITLSHRVQLITRFFGTPEEIHANFDFVHATNYWTHDTGLVLSEAAVTSLVTRELRYVGSRYPICSLFRVRKFLARGWHINAGQIVKIAHGINQLDLSSTVVWEDQLVGVDHAYFSWMVNRLYREQEKRAKANEPPLDSSYIIELIDRLF